MVKQLVLILFVCAILPSAKLTLAGEIPPQRQIELLYLLRHDCGSCHGMRLTGGLGPALTPHRLQNWSVEMLVATILHGRPGTPMPPWRPFLSESEAHWLAVTLKRGVL